MKKIVKTLTPCSFFASFCLLIVATLSSCLPLLDWRNLNTIDYTPPMLVDFKVKNEKEIALEFNEAVEPLQDEADFILTSEGEKMLLTMNENMQPGKEYRRAISLQDRSKNRLDLVLSFYGYNANVPRIVINELRVSGSGNKKDLVEFYVLEDGDIAGLAFYKGIPTSYDLLYVFPQVKVRAGEYIVLHCEPEGLPEEINETASMAASGGKEAIATARDFWLQKKEGLSGTNAVLSLCASPSGDVLDLVVYSNRTSTSDSQYQGFGSATNLLRAKWAFENSHWSAQGDEIAPEDCINPTGTTSTRTICRTPRGVDTNSKDDWYIVATSESTIGTINSTKKYSPSN